MKDSDKRSEITIKMSSDITSILQLDTDEQTKVITVKEINNCDSSFIISCVLNHCIKSKSATIFVSAHNPLQHYQQVGLKMSYSLQKHIDTGFIEFYNLGGEIADGLLLDQEQSLQHYFLKIKDKIQKMQETHKTVNFIIEGVSHLFDLDYTLQHVNIFCTNLIILSRNLNSSFIFFHCNIACDDDVTCIMANLLSHKSYINLEVKNLPSGWSTDVSGHLAVKYSGYKFMDDHMYNLEIKPVKYLFKLFDRGVKLLAPGTV